MTLAASYRPTGRLVALLFGGRVMFRVVVLGSNIVLAAHWGHEYAPYASALGASIFITALAALGVEKAGLKVAPRHPDRAAVISSLAVSAVLLLLFGLVVVGLRSIVAPGAMLLLAGLYAALLGHNQVLVGLYRAGGRPIVDPGNHFVLSGGLVVATWAAVARSWSPEAYLAVVVAILAAADVLLLTMLRPRGTWGAGGVVGQRVGLLRTTSAMAVGDMVPGILASVVFVLLEITGREDESTALYIATVSSALLISAFGYLLRIWQPQLSLNLRGMTDNAVREKVSLRLRTLLLLGTPLTVAVTLLALWLKDLTPGHLSAIVLGQYVLFIPLIFAMSSLNYLMENATASDLSATARAAVRSIAPALVAALVLVALFGAIGAVTTLACAELLHGVLLRRGLLTKAERHACG